MAILFDLESESKKLRVDEVDGQLSILIAGFALGLQGTPREMLTAIEWIMVGKQIWAFAIEGRYGNVSRDNCGILFNISGHQVTLTEDELFSFYKVFKGERVVS